MRLEYNDKIRGWLMGIIDISIPEGERQYMAGNMCQEIEQLYPQSNATTKLQAINPTRKYHYTPPTTQHFVESRYTPARSPGIKSAVARGLHKIRATPQTKSMGWHIPSPQINISHRTADMQVVSLSMDYYHMDHKVMVLVGYIPEYDTLLVSKL